MKNAILIFISALLIMQSCQKGNGDKTPNIPPCDNCAFTCLDSSDTDIISNNCLPNWDCNFLVHPFSQVDLNETDGLSLGPKNVFQMYNHTDGNPGIADDEYTHILVFELDESQTSFSVEDAALADMKVHFKRVCFCHSVTFLPISKGCLQGEKQIDGSWFIQGNLIVPFSFGDWVLKFDANFSY